MESYELVYICFIYAIMHLLVWGVGPEMKMTLFAHDAVMAILHGHVFRLLSSFIANSYNVTHSINHPCLYIICDTQSVKESTSP